MKDIIILLGVPGSGKGTEADLLSKNLGYAHLSTGDLLRALAKDEHADKEDKEKLAAMKRGELVSDDLIYKLAFKFIKKNIAQNKGVILDGAIRNVEQAKAYKKFFEEQGLTDILAIEITVDDETSLLRLSKRKVCSACRNIIRYSPENHLIFDCDNCGGKLETREDDNIETIKKRIKEQGNEKLKPIVDFYRSEGVLKTVDGMNTIEWIYKRIEKIVL